jgi:hypothetical protein
MIRADIIGGMVIRMDRGLLLGRGTRGEALRSFRDVVRRRRGSLRGQGRRWSGSRGRRKIIEEGLEVHTTLTSNIFGFGLGI